MIKVLFVCSGNICRSPMADAIFQQMVKDSELSDKISVDSAGTGGWHVGERAHHGTRDILNKHNIPYAGRARQLTQNDLKAFDYILAMDYGNLSSIRSRIKGASNAEAQMFLHYANEAGLTTVEEVPDPYYSGGYDKVYDLVDKGCRAFLEYIRKKHQLN
jgi:protein-tyrosine phosphatase